MLVVSRSDSWELYVVFVGSLGVFVLGQLDSLLKLDLREKSLRGVAKLFPYFGSARSCRNVYSLIDANSNLRGHFASLWARARISCVDGSKRSLAGSGPASYVRERF